MSVIRYAPLFIQYNLKETILFPEEIFEAGEHKGILTSIQKSIHQGSHDGLS